MLLACCQDPRYYQHPTPWRPLICDTQKSQEQLVQRERPGEHVPQRCALASVCHLEGWWDAAPSCTLNTRPDYGIINTLRLEFCFTGSLFHSHMWERYYVLLWSSLCGVLMSRSALFKKWRKLSFEGVLTHTQFNNHSFNLFIFRNHGSLSQEH